MPFDETRVSINYFSTLSVYRLIFKNIPSRGMEFLAKVIYPYRIGNVHLWIDSNVFQQESLSLSRPSSCQTFLSNVLLAEDISGRKQLQFFTLLRAAATNKNHRRTGRLTRASFVRTGRSLARPAALLTFAPAVQIRDGARSAIVIGPMIMD